MTILFVILFRLGCFIQIPGLNAVEIDDGLNIFSILNSITGSALSQGTIFSLGISPYINASIIVQLLTVAIPALERMSKEGEEGRKKIDKITRWVTLVLATISAVGVFLTFRNDASLGYINYSWLGGQWAEFFSSTAAGGWIMGIYIVVVLVGGSMLCMWLGERITEYGVSNGISMLIFVGIVASAAQQLGNTLVGGHWAEALIFVVELILVFGFIVWVDGAERKIKVQYAKQVKGNKMYGGQSTFIPIKVNASGVMPLIFAYAIMSFPTMLIQTFWSTSDFATWWNTWMTASGNACGIVVYNLILAILIFVFAYFYSQIQFNPVEISRNIQNNGGFVTGIRPGRETAEYLDKVVKRITLWGAVFLAIIAFVPSILFSIPGWAGMNMASNLVSSFSTTGMLICVSVALEFNKALENQILMRHYKGLLGSNSKGFLK
ncbi:MAG: preprotein translocase subunit SecY [Corallococcus sp.]|nr:preprotein translocase subunit SecY [Bacillota bacterium]MCM1533349.1 preprotein translocase subunit SecY [Corallococcus sp.]